MSINGEFVSYEEKQAFDPVKDDPRFDAIKKLYLGLEDLMHNYRDTVYTLCRKAEDLLGCDAVVREDREEVLALVQKVIDR